MPYTKTVWVNGTAPAINDTNLNKIEQGIYDALRQDGTTAMTGQIVTVAGSASAPAIAPTGDSNNGIFFPSADTIAMTTSGVEKMRLDSSGQLGIGHLGASDISAPLTVRKQSAAPSQPIFSIKGALSTGSDGHAIEFMQHATYTTGFIACNASGAGSGTDLVFGTTAAYGTADATEKMRIQRDGKVGIGTASPARTLELSAAGNLHQRLTSTTDAIVGLEFYSNGAQKALITGDSNGVLVSAVTSTPIVFSTNGTEKMRISAAGFVGIGTGGNTPTVPLQVYSASGDSQILSETNATGGTSRITLKSNGAGGGNWYFMTGDTTSTLSGRLRIWDSVAGQERMTILGTSGNVGIGTASPAELLEVSGSSTGTIYAKVTNTDATGNSGVSIANTGTSGRTFQIYVPGNGATNYKNSLVFNDTVGSIPRMLINASGYLLVGYITNNGAYPLQVNGQIFSTTSVIATSDARYKQNITSLDGSLDIIKALNPVQFDWKEHPVHKFNTDAPTVGFLAQEVAEVLKDKPYLNSIIKKNETEFEVDGETVKEEFLGIAEGNLIAILTKAVKELAAEVEALKNK